MANESQKADLIQQYLERLRIQAKSKSFDQYAERLAHLPAVREALERLSAKGYASSEAAAPIGPAEEPFTNTTFGQPDFIVLREDVLLHVYLSVGQQDEITEAQLGSVWEDFRQNPSLSAVVICVAREGYPSMVIDSFAIRTFIGRGAAIKIPSSDLKPLSQAIEEFFEAQLVDWHVTPQGLMISHPASQGFAAKLLQIFQETFRSESSRTYGIPEKIDALNRISADDIQKLIDAVTSVVAKDHAAPERLAQFEDLIDRLSER